MQIHQSVETGVETVEIGSGSLERTVRIDLYTMNIDSETKEISLLLINDGQDLVTMDFASILNEVNRSHGLRPLLIAGIHCGEDRRNEYGTVEMLDYKGRGAKAGQYEQFVLQELMPFVFGRFNALSIQEVSFAGFSLGGLSALDLVWRHPQVFKKAGVFSGSFWWRSRDQEERDFNPNTDRIMHALIRKGEYHPALRFFFECGAYDEDCDRNDNGVIDSIDDTIDIMRELLRKGYKEGKDFVYLQLPDGKHDVPTWAKALPAFLKWGWRGK